MLKPIAVASFTLFVAIGGFAQSPAVTVADALDKARAHIAKGEFAAAVNLLEPTLRVAPSISDDKMRDQALAAMHFYAAVGYAGMNQDREARAHLREFFALTPKASHVDERKYDRHFVTIFNSMLPVREEDRDSFSMYYPGYRAHAASLAREVVLPGWGGNPVLELLASSAEKRQWNALQTEQEKARFIADFWQRRDPNPATPENEFRNAFEQRVAFADDAFGTREQRGATSDRGKVFILLGVPSFVRRRSIGSDDMTGPNRVWVDPTSNGLINGTIEQWVYNRDQLPIRLTKPSITFRFVTQEGIGTGVWQKEDAYTQQALEIAANPNTAR